MDIFKTDVLRKEFEKFHKEVLVDVLKCGLRQKTTCNSFHSKFLVSYKFCQENYCKVCKTFKCAKEVLFFLGDAEKEYVQNFILDFLNLSAESLGSWSGLSQPFTSKGEKRDFNSDDEEEDQLWKSFCSESNKKVELWQPESSS